MRHFAVMSGMLAVSLVWAAAVHAQVEIVTPAQVPDAAVATLPDADAEAAEVAETPAQTAYLDQVVCRAAARAASRLRSRVRVCDTRRAWRDMDEAAAAETSRLQNMGRYNPTEDPLGRRDDTRRQ